VASEAGVIRGAIQSLDQYLSYIPPSRQVGLQAAAKRALDIIISSLLLVSLAPLWLLIAALIYLETGWPVFFRQSRLGLSGKAFTVFKFRSIHQDAEQRLHEVMENNEVTDGPIFKMRHDPRMTHVGRWLRRTSLDEFPQLLNVLKGDMSLVGPRPPLESEVVRYEPWHMRRLSVKPGMTGLWQVSGRSTLNFNEMVTLDNRYAETWSLWTDIELLIKTPLAVISGRGAF